jgi:hypothetical protein
MKLAMPCPNLWPGWPDLAFFAFWATVYIGQFFLITELNEFLDFFFSTEKVTY